MQYLMRLSVRLGWQCLHPLNFSQLILSQRLLRLEIQPVCISIANSLASLVPAKNKIIWMPPLNDHVRGHGHDDDGVRGHDHDCDVRGHAPQHTNDSFLNLDFHLIFLQ